ncbi:hypothetical protein [Sinanaerobacter sp. ZZT-01]|uniref:hypothetical protein n=1 Tax=Sinanaerobacter sp. ZZT-01 TaxID=3111540 RepID=UPI002D78CF74|nr:hypothetical protein [Sinanaerobacter sp. ZZT-01]WRR94960.1 hypothetical protein U5921_07520 [Sinanaerobacter sp. ZZT-01]
MQNTFIILILFIIIVGSIIALQIFLSRKKNKWLGLILPLICLIFSLIAAMGIPIFSTFTVTEQSISQGGEIINSAVESSTDQANLSSTIFMVIIVFLLYNIPTVILLSIYFACRETLKRKKELEKMNIQDLE